MTTYTIVNICPKKTFSSEEELKNYCETHVVPDVNCSFYPKDKFVIEKRVTETEEFTLEGMTVDTSINKELCLDIIKKVADKFEENSHAHIHMNSYITPYNSHYLSSKTSNIFVTWVNTYLRSIKENDIKEVFEVKTDYKPCNGFVIHINNQTYNWRRPNHPMIVEYNKTNNTNYELLLDLPIYKRIVSKVCGCSPLDVDFSTWSEEELKIYDEVFMHCDIYIQFRDNNIMIDTTSYTGCNVSHRENIPCGFGQERYKWCLDCVNGIFKKFK